MLLVTCGTPSVHAEEAVRHTLTVVAQPAMAGTFNTATASLATGETIQLYAYANSNFTFKEWRDAEKRTLSVQPEMTYTMLDKDVTLTAVYEYNPLNPQNPARNDWNALLGNVIVDDFTTGSLASAITAAINGSKPAEVLMITVSGRINTNDLGIINTYTNCTLLDLSRVSGLTEVPSYAFDYTKLESAYLPATVEKIGYRAFYECKQLTSLTVYAMVPPALDGSAFGGVQEGLVVYVPAAALTQYQEADGWKDFTILPIQEDIRTLTVMLPTDTKVADYAQMWLELTNTKSGQKMHYVMTDRTSYTFANIIRNTSWNAVLRNQRGDVFCKIDNIEVKDEDVSVTFASLAKPQSITLSVTTPDGVDVTTQTQVTWTDGEGNYLAQTTSLNGLLAGSEVQYSVTLPQNLVMQYVTPQQTAYTVKESGNVVSCLLEPIPQVTLIGQVKDATTKNALTGAIISASQTFGGKYSKTISTKTDAKGNYTLTVSLVPVSLSVSAGDCISQTVTLDQQTMDKETVTIPEVLLKGISGAVITLNLTYTKCPTDKDDDTFQNWYSDYNNVAYSLYNRTKQRAVTQFNVQHPQIVLLEDVDEGDVIELTATSKTAAFRPVTATATINAEQRAEATIPIVELGKIKATFAQNGNTAVVGTLYDAKGKLLKAYDYSNATLTISDLNDGDYTLVSMGNSPLFNTIYDLSQLPQTGLAEGTDYVQHRVKVASGQVASIAIQEVPALDESKLYYTGSNTSFTVNKSSIVAGNYLTLTGHLDFKSAYASSVSNVQLIVDLPESCQFVENSVMVGNATSNYILDGNRITIPLARYTDRVRFCIIPTLGGDFAPSALAQFDLNGNTLTQPIGSANYTVKDLSITVPSVVAKTAIPVSGTAIGASAIEIYDDGVLIGQTNSLANGTWATTCDLNEPYNLSTHNIYAKVKTKAGLDLQSENVACTYDRNAIEVKTVTMINTAHPAENLSLKDYVTVFDFQNPSQESPVYWYWPSYPDFTFIVDFTNNDTTAVKNVMLYVYTSDDDYEILFPTYDEKKDAFVASHKFTKSSSLPVNVNVEFAIEKSTLIDCRQIDEMYNVLEEERQNYEADKQEADKKAEELEQYALTDEDDIEDYLTNKLPLYLSKYKELYGVDISDEEDNPYSGMTPEEFFKKTEEEDIEDERVLAEISADLEGLDDFYSNGPYFKAEQDVCDGKAKVTVETRPNDKTEQQLQNEGFQRISEDGGTAIYVREGEKSYETVDVTHNVYSNRKIEFRNPDVYDFKKFSEDFIKDQWTNGDFLKTILWEPTAIDKLFYEDGFLSSVEKKALERLNYCKKQIKRLKKEGANEELIEQFENGAKQYKERLNKTNKYRWKELRGLKTLQATALIGGEVLTAFDMLGNIDKVTKLKESMNISVPYCVYSQNPQIAADIDNKMIKIIGDAQNLLYRQYWAPALWEVTSFASTFVAGPFGPLVIGMIQNWNEEAWMNLQTVKLSSRASLIKSEMIQATAKYCSREEVRKLARQMFGIPQNLPTPDAKFVLDPSGYVYEAVISNRLEGVTATIYQKVTTEDMYGDKHENIVKWDAEQYSQRNPVNTDVNGMYAWDVPQGMWQVKFEKEGYETTYSEWLPVPPPQLDVNIAMTQNVQPNVKSARAYEDAVEVEFDKYMLPELLSTENIVVMDDGKPVAGTVELLNKEVAYEGATETYASKVRFTASAPFEGQEVTLLVHNRVKSYAGIRMQDDFSQTFTIEQEIRQIVCDSAIVVGYGKTGLLTVSVLPASAAAGKPLTVRSSSSLILRSSVENIVLDDQGKAELTVYGELPGAAALSFTIDGYDLMAMTIVNVENIAYKTVATPTANVASGSTVTKGAEVTLSCKTEGATIYYTLDGSCPCDEATRLTYTAPIVINETVTIKAMAVASDMYESDVAEFDYTVLSSIVIPFTMTEVGWGTLIVPFYAEVPSGLTAYTCSRYSTAGEVNWLDLERTESLAANTPYILSGTAGEYSFTGVPDAELMSYTNGLLTGVYVATSIDRGYVLQKQDDEVAFFKVANGKQKTVPAYRCYLNDQPSGSTAFYLGGTTQIENAFNEVELSDSIVYDLQGRRCEGTLKSGVYIRNKQLFYVK